MVESLETNATTKSVTLCDLQEDIWALILSFCEDDETEKTAAAKVLRKTSPRLEKILTSHEYYYAANVLLGRFFNKKGVK